MKISVVQVIPFARPTVFRALRDHLPALVDYLPNIQTIEVRTREEPSPTEVHLVNFWQAAKTEVPTVARAFLDPAKLNWLDHSRWNSETWTNAWEMQVSFMKDRVTCEGRTHYLERSDGSTEARIEGVLNLDLKGMLPGLIARAASPKVESFVVDLIKPNFERTNDGLIRYLGDHPELC